MNRMRRTLAAVLLTAAPLISGCNENLALQNLATGARDGSVSAVNSQDLAQGFNDGLLTAITGLITDAFNKHYRLDGFDDSSGGGDTNVSP